MDNKTTPVISLTINKPHTFQRSSWDSLVCSANINTDGDPNVIVPCCRALSDQVHADQNHSCVKPESPLPAQVEGLASPRPWTSGLHSETVPGVTRIYAGNEKGSLVAEVYDETAVPILLCAVNSFDALVEALTDLLETTQLHSWAHTGQADCACKGCAIKRARAALKLAEGKQS